MSRPPSARLVAAGTIGVIAVLEAVVGWMLFMSFVQIFDDEGYMVTMYREWIGGGALYDQVYSQYGPFHAVAFGLPFRILGASFTLTSGRCITLALLVGTTVLLALVTLKLTRSIVSAVLAQLLTFWTMWVVITAPMHPAPLLMFLLAALVTNIAVVRARRPRISDWITGGLVAAAFLTKVNVGAFVAVAVVYVVALNWPADRTRRWLLPAAEFCLVALGPVLLLSQRSEIAAAKDPVFGPHDPHVIDYWVIAYVASALTLVVFTRLRSSRTPDGNADFSPARLAAGFGTVAAVAIGVVLLTGTSVGALVQGILIRPLGQADALTILPKISGEMLVLLVATPLLIGIGYAVSPASPGRAWLTASGTLRVAGGVLLLVAMAAPLQFAHLALFGGPFAYLPLAALIVLPRVGDATSATTGRTFLAALAVAQSLHAFPVAGVQLALALLFPIVCAVVMLDDGAREYAATAEGLEHQGLWQLTTHGIAVAVLLWAGWQERDATRFWVDRYQDAVALDLPASAWMRADPSSLAGTTDLLEQVKGCSQLVTYPGTYTLNLWAEIPPPNGFNATAWPQLLKDREQQATVDVLEQADDPVCFAVHAFDRGLLDPEGGPLERYLSDFVPRAEANGYQILVRPS